VEVAVFTVELMAAATMGTMSPGLARQRREEQQADRKE
jgi:hypothetical protein